MKLILEGRDGFLITDKEIEVVDRPPDVIAYGERSFRLIARVDGSAYYREASVIEIPEERPPEADAPAGC